MKYRLISKPMKFDVDNCKGCVFHTKSRANDCNRPESIKNTRYSCINIDGKSNWGIYVKDVLSNNIRIL